MKPWPRVQASPKFPGRIANQMVQNCGETCSGIFVEAFGNHAKSSYVMYPVHTSPLNFKTDLQRGFLYKCHEAIKMFLVANEKALNDIERAKQSGAFERRHENTLAQVVLLKDVVPQKTIS